MILSDEQQMLRDSAAGWVREHAPVSALRKLRGPQAGVGFDLAAYREMAAMGWTAMTIPEADGGFDFGHAAMGVLAEELGRNLVASPLIGSAVIVAGALALAGSAEQKAQWLPGLVSGDIYGALALDEGPRHGPASCALAARRDGDGWVLDGRKRPVFDGASGALLLVAARTAGDAGDLDGITLFLCAGDSIGLTLTAMQQIDSRGAAIADFSACRLSESAVLGTVGEGLPLLERLLDRGRAVLAAEMLGSAQQAFETTMEYLRTRIQFDKPIGSFQALQHRAADMLADLELTRSAVRAALAAIDAGDGDTPRLVSLAKALAGKTLRRIAQEMIQMHGGIGMTDEHDAGLYMKRAQVADMTLGNVAFHRERYARLSGI